MKKNSYLTSLFSGWIGLVFAGTLQAAPSQKIPKGPEAQGEVLYHNYCSVCHGDRGDGLSRATGSLNPPPKDFTKPGQMGRESMVAIVKNGKPGTAMAGWGTQLNDKEIATVVDYVQNMFVRIGTDPQLIRGKEIYTQTCSGCHGDRGHGSVRPEIGMTTPARSFADTGAREQLTRDRMIFSITNGLSGTYMISYRDKLSKKDIDAVADYIRAALMVPESKISGTMAHGGRSPAENTPASASLPKAETPAAPAQGSGTNMEAPFPKGLKGNAAQGKVFYKANCVPCHGELGDGKGPRAYFINPRPKNFLEPGPRAYLNRPNLFTLISTGKLGTEMPAWNKVIGDQEIADVAEYVFTMFISPKKSASKK